MATTPKKFIPKAIKEKDPPIIDEKKEREAAEKLSMDQKRKHFEDAEKRLESSTRLDYIGENFKIRHAGLILRGGQPLPVRGTKPLKKGDVLICREIDAKALAKKWPVFFRLATTTDS